MIGSSGVTFKIEDPNTESVSTLFSQLGNLLGVGKRDDGRYHLSDLCQTKNINKWAKYKPFRHEAWNFASTSDRDAARKEKNQGLVLPTLKNAGISSSSKYYAYLNDLAYGITQGMFTTSYEYKQPRGGSYSEPNRLRDFDGYNHLAQQPFTTGATLIYADGTQELYKSGTEVNRFLV